MLSQSRLEQSFPWEQSSNRFISDVSEDQKLSTSSWDIPPPPMWDDNTWDLELSQQLAAKLLLIEQQPEVQVEKSPPVNPRFKTEICRNFKEKGSCLYGDQCQFAHGKNELRQDVVRHTKYKTKLCQKYWIAGYCAYGPRCNFIHQETEKQRGQDPPSPTRQVIKRATTGYSRPGSNLPASLVRNVEDVIRMSKIRYGSQGDSGGDSGSEQGGVWLPPRVDNCLLDTAGYCDLTAVMNRPIGSERIGNKRIVWPGE